MQIILTAKLTFFDKRAKEIWNFRNFNLFLQPNNSTHTLPIRYNKEQIINITTMYNKKIALAAMGLLMTCTASAQETSQPKSYSYVELQGGAQMTLTDAKMDKLITPVGAVSFGHYFTPVVGARLHVNGWQAKSGYSSIDQYYKWNYITTDADLLINLSNLIWPKNQHFLNVVLLGGIGLTNSWGNAEANTLAENTKGLNMPLVWSGNRLSHNVRAGIRLETNPAKPFGVSLEVNANSLDDRFNSKFSDKDDWMITAMLGVSFRFGHKFKKATPAPVVLPAKPVEEPKPVVTEQPKPVVVKEEPKPVEKKVETLREEVFYKIKKSDISKTNDELERTAAYLKRNPDVKVSVTGYADKGTGNSEINEKYSRQRAQAFKDKLVKNYGIDESRIIVDAKGDSVQPFSENDKNRCVIVIGPAK